MLLGLDMQLFKLNAGYRGSFRTEQPTLCRNVNRCNVPLIKVGKRRLLKSDDIEKSDSQYLMTVDRSMTLQHVRSSRGSSHSEKNSQS